jgi:hypothetical protein
MMGAKRALNFGKSTNMIGYPIGIKVRHEIKNHEI